jgi:hypothetical protein
MSYINRVLNLGTRGAPGLMTRQYATWPDTELPALDGKTPRAAVATPEGRARIEELLREFEHHSHRAPFPEAFDFDELRQQLGLSAQRST